MIYLLLYSGSNKNVTPKKTGSNTVRTVRPSRPFNGNRPSEQRWPSVPTVLLSRPSDQAVRPNNTESTKKFIHFTELIPQ
ncbi:hypothetical protein BpHYR1_043860, partial [Brachionus plicatilis]